MLKVFISIFVLLFAVGCAKTKVVDIKSPCVGGAGSVCEKRPINTWLYDKSVLS